jgi:hypothetical protein
MGVQHDHNLRLLVLAGGVLVVVDLLGYGPVQEPVQEDILFLLDLVLPPPERRNGRIAKLLLLSMGLFEGPTKELIDTIRDFQGPKLVRKLGPQGLFPDISLATRPSTSPRFGAAVVDVPLLLLSSNGPSALPADEEPPVGELHQGRSGVPPIVQDFLDAVEGGFRDHRLVAAGNDLPPCSASYRSTRDS